MTNVTQMMPKAMSGRPVGRCYRECVRRTVELALDTEQMIRHRMATRGVSFEQAVNDSIRQGFDRGDVWEPYHAQAVGGDDTRGHRDRSLQPVPELNDE